MKFRLLFYSYLKLLLLLGFFAICFFVPYFYNQRQATGIFKTDYYIIWVMGCICWIYYIYSYAEPVNYLCKIFILISIYVLLLSLLKSFPDENSIYLLVTMICCAGIFYFLQIIFLSKYYLVACVAFFATCISQLYIGLLQASNNNLESLAVRGWFYNSGFFGNYLAGIIPLLLAATISSKFKKYIRLFSFVVSIASVLVLTLTMARAAFIGTFTGCLVLILYLIKGIRIQQLIVFVVTSILFILVGIGVLYKLKPVSALGRLTIYQVSFNIIKDHPLTGVGPNRFGAVYNNYQSDYFRTEHSEISRQLTASNTLEAFNSIMQLLAEYGVLGFLLLIFSGYQVIKRSRSYKETSEKEWLRLGSIGCIVSIIASSLFSNPFHVTPVLLIFVYHLSVVLPKQKLVALLSVRSFLSPQVLIVFAFTVFVAYYIISQNYAQTKWYRASELAKYDSFERAEKFYKEAYPVLRYNGDFLFNYGAEAYLAGKYIQSIQLLERSRRYSSANNIYIYLGNAYLETNQFSLAEENYLHAIYMVPSHIYPKYQLIKLYRRWNKPDQERDWTVSVLRFPIKVKSQFTDDLIKELKGSLKN